jgi:hypothetical protein
VVQPGSADGWAISAAFAMSSTSLEDASNII